MSVNKNRIKLLAIYLSVIVVLIMLLFAIDPLKNEKSDNSDVDFPPTIGGLELEYDYGGERAMVEIKKMHMGEFDIEEGSIGYYEGSGGASAYFWVSVCSNEEAAIDLIEKMTVKISTVESPFSTPESVSTEYSQVELIYYTYGTGQEHYYWQDGKIIVWVALENMDNIEIKNFVDEAIDVF